MYYIPQRLPKLTKMNGLLQWTLEVWNEHKGLHVLNVAKMGIRPVELVVGVVNGDPIRPLDLGGDDCRFVGAVHPDTADKGFVAPVRPENKSEKERS